MQVFPIMPDREESIVSPDGVCRIYFPIDASYWPLLGYCIENDISHPHAVINRQYGFYPQDVPLRKAVKIEIHLGVLRDDIQNLGVYQVGPTGSAAFVGNTVKNGSILSWTGKLGCFTVLEDTVPPEVEIIYPGTDMKILEPKPKIAVAFRDTLSGILGEQDYIFELNGRRLIVEYDPEEKIGFHQIRESLSAGEHHLSVTIRDRAGNVTTKERRFTVTSK